MSKTLALLSGKGGSGKTTLGLSMASLLSACKIKVLLVDCDLSTNGATYFYENKLSEYSCELSSFAKILEEPFGIHKNFVKINKYLDFIPSITRITKESTGTYAYDEMSHDNFNYFLNALSSEYDVILFDCQAGYTDILKIILPIVDKNLVVTETDAISSASLRSLYLKIGDIIKDKIIYQIFNKVTKDEYDIYSKLSGGTVFTTIETVIFDWKIRKAFAIAQIPDMENTSANYGEQIYNICNILFSERTIQEKLKRFKTLLEIHKNSEIIASTEEIIEKKFKDRQTAKNKVSRSLRTMSVIFSVISVIVGFIVMIEEQPFKEFNTVNIVIVLFAVIIGLGAWVFLEEEITQRRDANQELESYTVKLSEAYGKLEQLKRNLKLMEQEDNSKSKNK